MSDPFSSAARGACIPRFPALRSQKVTSIAKFTMQTGTNGYGYIDVMPTLANDTPIALYSTSAYTGTPASASNVIGATGTATSLMNSPYSKAQLTAAGLQSARGRIISVAVRLTPVCRASDFGGLVTCYVDPDHSNIASLSGTDILSRPTASVMRTRPNGHMISAGGVTSEELEYSSPQTFGGVYPYSVESLNTTDTLVGGAPMGIRVQSGAPGIDFYVELIQHMEFTGPLTSTAQSESHVDPNGFAAANAASIRVHSAVSGRPVDQEAYRSYFVSAFNQALKAFTPDSASIGRMVGSAIGGYTSGRLGSSRGGLRLVG